VSLHRGRGDMHTVRAAAVLDAHAGLWVQGWRLQAAGCVLEAVMRVLPEDEPSEETWHLLGRALSLIASAAPVAPGTAARLHPLVLGAEAKLLVVSGLLPVLGACASCGSTGQLDRFSAAAGGALCAECSRGSERVEPGALRALAGLVGHPLAQAGAAMPAADAPGVERLIGLVLREHLGVRLRSASPL
jgi:DNA repair protein RecO (recombination protein O)